MSVAWGIMLVALGLLGWGGQLVSWVAPATATKWGLREADDAVEPVFSADVQGEAAWDTITLWTLVVAGVLLVAGNDLWPYFGLVGGAFYVYFGGRGLLTRSVMQRRGFRTGSAANVRTAFVFLSLSLLAGAVTVGLALAELGAW